MTNIATLRPLTPEEQVQFRQDIRDQEAEIQKNIGLYVTAMVVVTAWLVSRGTPILLLLLGNTGYNVFALLVLAFLNGAFLAFVTYKGLVLHEYAQFLFYLSTTHCGYTYWESWRRNSFSVNRILRSVYYSVVQSFAPVMISAGLLWALIRIVWMVTPADVLRWTGNRAAPADFVATLTALRYAKWISTLVLIMYLIWGAIAYESGRVSKQWNKLLASKPGLPNFKELEINLFKENVGPDSGTQLITPAVPPSPSAS